MMSRMIVAMLLVTGLGLPQATRAQPPVSKAEWSAAMIRIQAAYQAAAQAEIPESLLESKVREGQAKNVPMDRIATAVEMRLEALIRAREVLQIRAELELRNAGELSVAADALQAGVSEEVLVDITRTAPAERRAVATAVLAQLVQLGFESQPALIRVNTALAAGPEALANLRAEVAAALRIGGGPLLDELLNGGG